VNDASLDVELVVRRRTELGMSQRALAAEAGMTSAALSILEAGSNHAEVTLKTARRLADALGLPLRALFPAGDASVEQEPRPDDALVEAVIVSAGQAIQRHEIARILGWDIDRTGRALEAVRTRLEGSGVVLHRASSGYMIRHRVDLLSEDEILELERLRLRTRQVREPAMRLLLKIVRDGLPRKWAQTASNADRVALQMLIKSGLVAETKTGFAATPPLIKSLKLDCGGSAG
jgi:transcriptional regulator with XRE-family HTH domain